MIDVVNCTHHYGIRPVLKDIHLHVNAGELLALMGPNGMGKSTLLAVMAGVLAPARGYVEVGGKRRRRSVEEETAVRKMVVYLTPEIYFPMFRTPREWIISVGRLYEHDDLHLFEHCDRLLDLFDLGSVADSGLASLSSGQRKKVWLSGALITE